MNETSSVGSHHIKAPLGCHECYGLQKIRIRLGGEGESFENWDWNAENFSFYDNKEDGIFSDEKHN